MSRSATTLCLIVFILHPQVYAQSEQSVPPGQLRAVLRDFPDLVERDGRLWWSRGARAFAVVGAEQGAALVETRLGPVLAAPIAARADGLEVLEALLTVADQAGLEEGPGWRFDFQPLLGPRLLRGGKLVLEEGVLQLIERESRPVGERAAVERALAAFDAALDGSSLSVLGQQSVRALVALLPQEDGGRGHDEIEPSVARRLIRCGWLLSIDQLAALPESHALTEAVRALCALRPAASYQGPGRSLVRLEDGFGRGGWMYKTPDRTAYEGSAALPMYHGVAREALATARVVVELGAGGLGAVPAGAALWHEGTLLARWSPGSGLVADEETWREHIPARSRRLDPDIVEGYLPPHIVVADLYGDVRCVLSAGGVLLAPRDASDGEARRFLDNAAEVLIGAAALDLIGQYLFDYMYDSPDTSLPTLIGNPDLRGDIHQNAFETLATANGGICRGDCDDLSELYAVIAERQGCLVHVISLPMHVAACWAEERDGQWHCYVMQTGPTLEFVAPTLPEALEATYRSFDESVAFDPNEIGITLRFSGENTRSSWLLGFRIFSDPDYAQTMIDVSRDWHFQTYLQATSKMQELIAAGNHDTANYRELAALGARTGQFGLAVDFQEKVIERTSDPRSVLKMTLELIRYNFEAGRDGRAQSLVQDVLARQLPALERRMNSLERARVGLDLVSILDQADAHELALLALYEVVMPTVRSLQGAVVAYLESPGFDPDRWAYELALRDILRSAASEGLDLIHALGPERLRSDVRLRSIAEATQVYHERILAFDIFSASDMLGRYAWAASFYEAFLGEEAVQAMVEQSDWPQDEDAAHAARLGGLIQMPADLPWIRASVPYWFRKLAQLFDEEASSVDRATLEQLSERLDSAVEMTGQLGMDSPSVDGQRVLAEVLIAFGLGDHARLRAAFEQVAARGDRGLRDRCNTWLGMSARFLSVEDFLGMMQVWQEVLDYKPSYFLIAWAAALNDAPEHAMAVARLAAERFPDDPTFAEEYAFMVGLYGEGELR